MEITDTIAAIRFRRASIAIASISKLLFIAIVSLEFILIRRFTSGHPLSLFLVFLINCLLIAKFLHGLVAKFADKIYHKYFRNIPIVATEGRTHLSARFVVEFGDRGRLLAKIKYSPQSWTEKDTSLWIKSLSMTARFVYADLHRKRIEAVVAAATADLQSGSAFSLLRIQDVLSSTGLSPSLFEEVLSDSQFSAVVLIVVYSAVLTIFFI